MSCVCCERVTAFEQFLLLDDRASSSVRPTDKARYTNDTTFATFYAAHLYV